MKILLINYDFPPNPGIGGRRWAKVVKYMAKIGHMVHVVKADFPEGMEPSAWQQDVLHDNIFVHNAARKYPKAISHPQFGLIGKIKFHIQKQLLLWREKGTIYDQSIGWNKTMLPLCRNIIRTEKIDAMIATGAPWNLLVFAAQLKSEFPQCKLLVDYRDPWLTARNYGMEGLSDLRKKIESDKQQFVFEHADMVSTTYEYLTTQLQHWSSSICHHQPKFVTLAHFFDEQDFLEITPAKIDATIYKMVYAGDIYFGSEAQWNRLVDLIEDINHRSGAIHNIQLDLYTSAKIPTRIENASWVQVHAPVGKSIFSIMQAADALLIVLPENKKNECTTKFFEYLPLRKPILAIAPAGDVTAFVEDHHLGVHIGQPTETIETLLSGEFLRNQFNRSFEITSYKASTRAQEVVALLS
jgi:hypothetical protein